MRAMIALALSTAKGLRRDAVVLPAVGICGAVFCLANLASGWSIADFKKILFDLGAVGFHLTGGVVAILWGARILSEARRDGTVEFELSGPVSRTTWVLGKYFGLALTLVLLGIFLIGIWQGVMVMGGYGWMARNEWLVFAYLLLMWLVIAAVVTFFSSFSGSGVASFASAAAWVAGLSTEPVAFTLAPETPEITRTIVEFLVRVWNLQSFNLVDALTGTGGRIFPTDEVLGYTVLYALGITVVCVGAACGIVGRKDLSIG